MKSHGLSQHPIYHLWNSMKSRCNCPGATSYKNYGAKGVRVCKEWNDSFMSFYEWAISNGWAEGLSIERIESTGNYEPSNCTFIPRERQSANRGYLKKYTINGETKILYDWCRDKNMPPKKVQRRMEIGWSFERAITQPIKSYNTQSK